MSCLENLRGFLPNSMLDWPGKICTVLFLSGCNFRCPYCHNPELVEEGGTASIVSWVELSTFLEKRAGWIDGVSITGGEPTLHSDLPQLCRGLRDLGMLVKIDTNGSRPRMLEGMLRESLLNSVSMDLKTSIKKYPQVVRRPVNTASIEESINIILSSAVEYEFRCTVVPGLVELSDLWSLAKVVAGARGLVLQQFRPDITLDPVFAMRKAYPDGLLLEWADELSSLLPTRVRGLVGVYQE
jgi:pyruvate formate lyase activating enzyme